jgi:stage III sporulation protein AD
MIKIAAVAVMAAILAAWIKTVKPDYGVWIVFGAGIFLGFSALLKLETIIGELQYLQGYFTGYGTYFKLLIKIIGITYLAEFSADLCKDAGANTLASQIELFGKLSILVLCMPILNSLLETIDYFLGG